MQLDLGVKDHYFQVSKEPLGTRGTEEFWVTPEGSTEARPAGAWYKRF